VATTASIVGFICILVGALICLAVFGQSGDASVYYAYSKFVIATPGFVLVAVGIASLLPLTP
jgi:hypothetical protein